MIEYDDFTPFEKPKRQAFDLPRVLREISISYDGGRLSVYMNGQEVYKNMLASNDFCVTINGEDLPDDNAS